MNLGSIKFKVVAIITICMAIALAVIMFLFNLSYKKTINLLAEESLKTAIATFNNLNNDDIDLMSSSLELLIDNDNIRNSFTAKDRASLLKYQAPIYERFEKRYGFTNWNNIGTDENQFLRLTEPQKFGDKITRYVFKRSVQTQDWVSGLDLGNHGFALRVIHPVYDKAKIGNLKNGNVIGYMEIGKDVNRFLDSMKVQTGNDFGLVILKKLLKEEKWKSYRDYKKLRNNWSDQKDIVLSKNTTTDDSIFHYDGDVVNLSSNGKVLEIMEKNSKVFVRSVFPMKNAEGKPAGAIFVVKDITSIHGDMKSMQLQTVLYIIAIMILITILLIMFMNKLIFKRLNNMIETATMVVGGNYNLQIKPSADDEIGKFEELFEQFRAIFVSIINDLENKK